MAGTVIKRKSTISSKVFNDWFLGSRDEMSLMYTNLKANGIGGFLDGGYWSSSEFDTTPFQSAYYISFANGNVGWATKNTGTARIRACRTFNSTSDHPYYAIGDVGPAGGWIFMANNNGDGTYTYLEASTSDQSVGTYWSNVISELGTTELTIGTGQANTTAIIGQALHTDSAANICDIYTHTRIL